jgi:hypothetical protein
MTWAGNGPSTGHGSLSLSGELSTDSSFLEPAAMGRRAERVAVEVGAGLRPRGARGVPVKVTDISTDGFRATTRLDLETGSDVWLRLPGLEASHARVVWRDGQFVGCAFVRPLHRAVVDMIVRNEGPR